MLSGHIVRVGMSRGRFVGGHNVKGIRSDILTHGPTQQEAVLFNRGTVLLDRGESHRWASTSILMSVISDIEICYSNN
jgi:hypothetical protein